MSMTSQREAARLTAGAALGWVGSLLGQAWSAAAESMEVWHQQRVLETLDDRMLKDLGITRAQAEFEATRLPWLFRRRGDA